MVFKCNLEFEFTDQPLNIYLNDNDVINLLSLLDKEKEKKPCVLFCFLMCKLQSK